MKKSTFKGVTNRLEWLKQDYYAIQFFNLLANRIPTRGEMKYIKLIISELQDLGYHYDLYCLERDWANGERKDGTVLSLGKRKKAIRRLQAKWQRN